MNINEIAVDVENGDIRVNDLFDDIEFLENINFCLKRLMDKKIWNEFSIAEKRKLILEKITSIKNREEDEEDD